MFKVFFLEFTSNTKNCKVVRAEANVIETVASLNLWIDDRGDRLEAQQVHIPCNYLLQTANKKLLEHKLHTSTCGSQNCVYMLCECVGGCVNDVVGFALVCFSSSSSSVNSSFF